LTIEYNIFGYILLGGKTELLTSRQIYIKSLRWAIEVVRTPKVNDSPNGLTAYAIWADDMLNDDHFPPDDMEALSDRHHRLNCNLTIVDDRGTAAKFLRQIAEEEADLKADLLAAAEYYSKTAQLVWVDSNKFVRHVATEESFEQMANPEIRRQYSEMILKMRDNDEKAIELIEHALAEKLIWKDRDTDKLISEPKVETHDAFTVAGLIVHHMDKSEDIIHVWEQFRNGWQDKLEPIRIDDTIVGLAIPSQETGSR